MTNEDLFSKYGGRFMNLKLKGKDEFIKVVFQYKVNPPPNNYIDADVVADGNEEEYLSKYITFSNKFKKIQITASQIEKFEIGNKLKDGIPYPRPKED